MVKQLTFDDFFDFHELSKAMILNRSITTDGDKVEWLKIKWLRFQKCSLNAIFYKERLLDESFKEIAVTKQPGNARRTSRRQLASDGTTEELEKAHDNSIPILAARKLI